MHRSLVILAVTGAGCATSPDLLDVLPDERIEINLPTGAEAAKAVDPDKAWATFYLFTAEITENVNGLVGGVLYWVGTLTSTYPPTWVDEDRTEASWGPWSRALDPVETLLWVAYEPADDTYDWGIDQWPREATAEEALPVILGEVDAGATREASSGRFTIDFDTRHMLDPTEEAVGFFTVDYAIREDGASGWATFEDFGPEGIDAAYFYDQTRDGEGSMDLTVESDLTPGLGTGLTETWDVHSRWLPTGAGRADVVVSGGDLGALTGHAVECWSASFERIYYTDDFSGTVEGDEALCVY